MESDPEVIPPTHPTPCPPPSAPSAAPPAWGWVVWSCVLYDYIFILHTGFWTSIYTCICISSFALILTVHVCSVTQPDIRKTTNH